MSLFRLLLVTSLSSAIAWIVYSWVCLLLNYLKARKVGVPIRIILISHGNPFWILVDRKVVSFFKKLPFGNGNFTRYNWRGWEVEDRYRSHLEMGDVYMQFCQVEGPQWKQQRKITSSCFNEQTNEIVWSESVSLANDMLRYWASKESVRSVADDVRTFSLHVLSKAGFGKSYKFHGHDEGSATSPATSYKESLKVVLENCILIMALGTEFLSKPWLPQRFRMVHQACVSFQNYMTKVYEDEKRALEDENSVHRNIMTSLIRASHEEALTSGGLTEKEVYGNLFVLNFAGHDTTANTLTYAIMFLAANPAVQDWLSEELHHVLGDRQLDEWKYGSDFPRLKRCLAVLMETVRLYTPVPVAKWTENSAQTLQVGDKTITIPPETMVIPSYAAVHTHPRYWGPDALAWRPSRWITKSSANSNSFDDEDILNPQRGAFIPWSEGERSCPGKKFSQVEFVAAIAGLFRDWKAEPTRQKGETLEGARARVLELIEKDSAQALLLRILHPERAPLVWRRR
ncbi:hypothetical protein Hte_010332 [Hypoxylon texense]